MNPSPPSLNAINSPWILPGYILCNSFKHIDPMASEDKQSLNLSNAANTLTIFSSINSQNDQRTLLEAWGNCKNKWYQLFSFKYFESIELKGGDGG